MLASFYTNIRGYRGPLIGLLLWGPNGIFLKNLASGKHWNSVVSSPSSVFKPAIPPFITSAVKGAKWGFVLRPRQTGAHQAFRLIASLDKKIHICLKKATFSPTELAPPRSQSNLSQSQSKECLSLPPGHLRLPQRKIHLSTAT